MNPKDHILSLQTTAATVLPGMKDIPPQLIADVTQVKAMLRAFGKLGGMEH